MGAVDRSAQLRALTVAYRLMWGVVLTPYALFPLVVVSAGQQDDPGSPAVLVGVFAACVGLPFVVIMVQLHQVWAFRAYDDRLTLATYRPVLWSEPAWASVRAAFVSAGLDPAEVHALSRWDDRANMRAHHVSRRTPGRLGGLSDWSVRWRKPLVVTGAALGVTAAVFENEVSAFMDSPFYPALLVPVLVAIAPVAWRNLTQQIRLNLRDPRTVVLIPTRWKSLLGRDPRAAVRMLHEIAHVRHSDPVVRRLVPMCATWAKFLVFLCTAPVMGTAGDEWLLSGASVLMFVLGMRAVGRASRLLPVIQELRADAEACRDTTTTADMADFLRPLQKDRPSEEKELRLALLAHRTGVPGLTGRLVRPVAVMAVYGLVSGGLAVAQLTGVVTQAP